MLSGVAQQMKAADCRGLKSDGDFGANRISFCEKGPILVTMH
jgi:hypothetical protein